MKKSIKKLATKEIKNTQVIKGGNLGINPCDASWGVDDVKVYAL